MNDVQSLINLVNDLSRLINQDEYDVDEANELLLGIREGLVRLGGKV